MSEREEETESTADQTSGKVRWRPEEASMKAILPWWARDEMKVVTSRDSLEGKAMGLRLLQKVVFDLEKPLLGSIGGMLICAMGVPGTGEVFPLFFFLDEVAGEAATGKMYRSNYSDKHGRPVIVMRPSRQNSKTVPEQVRCLVHCIENAILNLPENQEEMVWLVDFSGSNSSNISFKMTRETAYVVQVYYPERLGLAILYNPPKFFAPFWKVAKLFLEPKTANKVKFVYSKDPNTLKIMEEEFDVDQLESAFGGKDNADFDFDKYSERMREDDKRMQSQWEGGNIACEAPPSTLIPSQVL